MNVPTAGGFLLRCVDGEAKRYTVGPYPAPPDAAEREARWLAAAVQMLRASQRYPAYQLATRLLAGGAYHGEPPRATLAALTDRPPFVREPDVVTFRPDVSPALWRLVGDRRPYSRPGEAAGSRSPPPPLARGVAYRLRAHLHRGPWWAEFEAVAEHSLDQLLAAMSRVTYMSQGVSRICPTPRHGNDPPQGCRAPGERGL